MPTNPRLRALAGVGARFLTVGAISTIIEIAVFNVCLLGFGWDPAVSKIVASLVALVNAYLGNRQWAFRDRVSRRRWVEMLLFVGVNVVCVALGAALVWVGVEAASWMLGRTAGPIAVNVVNLVSIVIVVFVRFALYARVVFPAPANSAEK